jgi:RsiW-degrading membrane proteinase PrsW (M82 family)
MESLMIVILAVIPVALLLFYIYKKDFKKESKGLLIKLFLAGIASCIVTLIITGVEEDIFPFFGSDTNYMGLGELFIYFMLGVAIIEEFSKLLMTYLVGYNNKEYDEVFDGIVYAVFVSLGFACFENVLYLLAANSGGLGINPYTLGVMRGFTAVPSHAADAVLMGTYLSIAKTYRLKGNKSKEKKNLILALVIPMLAHGFYDFCLSTGSGLFLLAILAVEIGIFVYCVKKINKISKENNHILNNPEANEDNTNQNINYNQNINNNQNMKYNQNANNNQNAVLNTAPASAPKYCRNCGSPVNGTFCSNCGSRQ